jgi:hypothetical protein
VLDEVSTPPTPLATEGASDRHRFHERWETFGKADRRRPFVSERCRRLAKAEESDLRRRGKSGPSLR